MIQSMIYDESQMYVIQAHNDLGNGEIKYSAYYV